MEKNQVVDTPKRRLSNQQADHILHEQIYPKYFTGIERPSNKPPQLIYIVGQPGSGKSWFEKQVTDNLNCYAPNTAVGINCDDMRPYHPHFASLQADDDIGAALSINPDNAYLTDALIDKSISIGCQVTLEGTFRNPESVAATASKYREAGYEASAIVITTHPVISRLGIIDRYLDEREQHGVGRFTYSHIHDETIAAIPETVRRFIHDRLGTALTLTTRTGDVLYSIETQGMGQDELATAATEAHDTIAFHHNRSLTKAEYDDVNQAILRNFSRAVEVDAPSIVLDELLKLYDDTSESYTQ